MQKSPSNYHNTKYRSDPAYRLKTIERNKRYAKKLKDNKTFQTLRKIRRRICEHRNSIDYWLQRIAAKEKQLLRLVSLRDKYVLKFREERQAQKFNAATDSLPNVYQKTGSHSPTTSSNVPDCQKQCDERISYRTNYTPGNDAAD